MLDICAIAIAGAANSKVAVSKADFDFMISSFLFTQP
jgi:hypothetical protein